VQSQPDDKMLRIGVISDTHVHTLDELPTGIIGALSGVDLIVHAGDFTHSAVFNELKLLGNLRAVQGNMDSRELRALLPHKDSFMLGGKRIGLVHGSGAPWGIASRVREMFTDEDVIIFGHSHVPHNMVVKGSLLFNPGAARYSFGILTIGDEVSGEIFQI
jgi:putative phosphoesterase